MMHACDLGSTVQRYDVYIHWCGLVAQEFDSQVTFWGNWFQIKKVLKEEEKGIEVSTYMKYKDIKGFYYGQIAFSSIWNSYLKLVILKKIWLFLYGNNCRFYLRI